MYSYIFLSYLVFPCLYWVCTCFIFEFIRYFPLIHSCYYFRDICVSQYRFMLFFAHHLFRILKKCTDFIVAYVFHLLVFSFVIFDLLSCILISLDVSRWYPCIVNRSLTKILTESCLWLVNVSGKIPPLILSYVTHNFTWVFLCVCIYVNGFDVKYGGVLLKQRGLVILSRVLACSVASLCLTSRILRSDVSTTRP